MGQLWELLGWLLQSNITLYVDHVSFVQNREPMMPSPQFIKSYFSSFTDDIISKPLQKGEKKDEDKDKEGEAAEVTWRWDNIYPGSTEQ